MGNGSMAKKKALESFIIPMETIIQANLEVERPKEREDCYIRMEISIADSGKMTRLME